MFVAWQRKPLSASGKEHGACSHPFEGLGRETIKPVVRVAFRLDGKPRNRVVARPACSIRRCCLEDMADPIARGQFWQSARHRAGEAAARVGAKAEGVDPLEVELWRDRAGWLFGELAKVVPDLAPAEQVVYDLWGRPEGHFLRGVELEGYAGRLEAARERAEAYRKGRRRGETPHAWWCRVDPPPRFQRLSLEDLFAHSLGRAPAPSPTLPDLAAERRRQAQEDRVWAVWSCSPPGTPPPHHDVPPQWQEIRTIFLEINASAGASPWGAPAPAADFMTIDAGHNPTRAQLAAAAGALGLRWPCSIDDARAAYRRLAASHHPDRNAGPQASARMARINVAYSVVQRGQSVA